MAATREHENPDGSTVTVTLGHDVRLTFANWCCAGRDPRGYEVNGYLTADGALRVNAGCRDFTLAEARAHWSRPEHAARDILLKIDHLVAALGPVS